MEPETDRGTSTEMPVRLDHHHVKPLKRDSLRGDITKALKAAILNGELADGEKFSMGDIAERFGASRTPVREALLELEKRGLVEILPSVGFRVTPPTKEDLREMLEIREMLEVPALALVVGRLSPTAIEEANRILEALEDTARQGDVAAFHELDRRFHVHIVRQAGNKRLASIIEDLREVQWPQGFREEAARNLDDRNVEHRAILQAIVDGKKDLAEAALRQHLEFSRRAWGVINE